MARKNPVFTVEKTRTPRNSRVPVSKQSTYRPKATSKESNSATSQNSQWPGDTPFDDLDEDEFMDDVPEADV